MSKWDKRIAKAEKYLEKALAHGRKVYARYQDDRSDTDSYAAVKRVNLFYANVSTMKESLFNSLPKPDVSRLHKGDYDDDVARVAALVVQRGLHYEVNCAKSFKEAVESAILDRLVPGIGQVWLRFEMEQGDEGPIANSEQIFIDTVYWEDFLYEPSRTWTEVTWVGRKLDLTKKEVTARWGEEAASQIQMARNTAADMITPKEVTEDKYCVYEIWDRNTRKVYHISKGLEEPLDVKDDPYGLKDFFPCPKPLIANPTTTAFLPVTDYHIAQDQYTQLDVLYARISMLIDAVKVAGCYDASETAIGNMLQGQENKLVPVDNWAMYAEKGGSKGMIDWYPVDQVAAVLQMLQAQFEAIKAMLYEITGMSDIMRGASNQYETAAAQQIKAQFAGVRMNGMQRDIANFVVGILRITTELMTQLYSDQKIMQIVGNLSEADQQYLPQVAQVLRNDFVSSYKIDISADSLTQSDWALEKGQRMELVGYLSQFLQSAVPAVESNPGLATLLMSMMKFTVAGFKGAAEIEGIIDQQVDQLQKAAQNPQPPEPSPEEKKVQAEMQMEQMRFEMDAKKLEADVLIKQREAEHKAQLEQMQAAADMEVERQKMELQAQLQSQKLQSDLLLQQQELAHLQRKYEMELEFKRQEHQMKMAVAAQTAAIKSEAAHEAAELKREGAENGNEKD